MKTIALRVLTQTAVLAVAATAILAAGCAAVPVPPAWSEPYDLGPLPPIAVVNAASAPVASTAAPVIWGGISAPLALDSTAIIYRLLYVQGGQQPRPYAHARWAAPPAQLLSERLRAALAATRPVVDTDAGLTAPELRVELDQFSQTFDTPDQSFGVIRLRATRLAPSGAGGAQQVEQRSFAARVLAPSNDAAGGAQALKAAADQVIGEVVAWLGAQP